MKIKCPCGNIIVDQTDYLRIKGYLISDTQWFDLWDSIDEEIEQSKKTKQEETNFQLKKQKLFRLLWECNNCGKLFIDGDNGDLLTYSPDNMNYNKVLDKYEILD